MTRPTGPVRITPELWVAAAERLIGQRVAVAGDPARARVTAARRFVDQAPGHGIDMSLTWATLDPTGRRVRQACMGVLGSGRTAMLFVSGPAAADLAGTEGEQHAERVDAILACTEGLGDAAPSKVALAQALPEPHEAWSIAALRAADYLWVGNLSYLRRPSHRGDKKGPAGFGKPPTGPGGNAPELPQGVEVTDCAELLGGSGTGVDEAVGAALERSYIDTLDCPALCGLRSTDDVLHSHKDTGEWDPAMWWVVWLEGQPEGCMLLAQTPEHDAVELVYIGLGPKLRGIGLGRRLLDVAVTTTAKRGAKELTCAVDRANEPAMKLYRSMGFVPFASRVAFVKPIGE